MTIFCPVRISEYPEFVLEMQKDPALGLNLLRMADITMCLSADCPLRTACYRHTAEYNDLHQSVFMTPPYDEKNMTCEMFWSNDRFLSDKTNEN